MIKSNELRIGNLVDRTDYICEVKEIRQDGIITKPLNYNGERFVVQTIKPIPLTREIFKTVGFHEGDSRRPSYKNFEIYELSENQLWLCDNGCHNVYAQVEYLHQLQNLYFALTNEELEIQWQ